MNFRQLKAICEVVDSGLTVTGAAHATHRSQSSVTRQVQQLEEELGFKIFTRNRNKLLCLSPKGEEILLLARRMLQDAEDMRRIGRDVAEDKKGSLTIAMTHVQARYVLPPVIHRFMQQYPQVALSLRQGNPMQCCTLVASGKADIAICSDPKDIPEGLVRLPCYTLHRAVVTPLRHPLLRIKPLTLEAMARFPLITYDEAFSGRLAIDKAFTERALRPTIVLSASDADISKVYVGMGLGIAIFDSIAFDPKRDVDLRCLDARHLFEPSHLNLVIRRDSYLRSFTYGFIQMFAPRLTRQVVDGALFDERVAPEQGPELLEELSARY